MGNSKKDCDVPERGTAEYYRMEIANNAEKIEDERFLKRIYIILRNHKEKRGD